eukprot:96121-Pelagomonas_calceolata.AAC.3
MDLQALMHGIPDGTGSRACGCSGLAESVRHARWMGRRAVLNSAYLSLGRAATSARHASGMGSCAGKPKNEFAKHASTIVSHAGRSQYQSARMLKCLNHDAFAGVSKPECGHTIGARGRVVWGVV